MGHQRQPPSKVLPLCRQAVHVVPLTFTDRSSFIKVDGNEGQQQVNISFSFRTYEPDGVMAYHDFNSAGYVKVHYHSLEPCIAICWSAGS